MDLDQSSESRKVCDREEKKCTYACIHITHTSHTRVHTCTHKQTTHTSHTHTLIHINAVSVSFHHLTLNRAHGPSLGNSSSIIVSVRSVAQLCLTLYHPVDCSLPGASVHGFSRQEYWSGLPCPPPGNLSDLGIKSASPVSPAVAGRFLTTETPGKPHCLSIVLQIFFL